MIVQFRDSEVPRSEVVVPSGLRRASGQEAPVSVDINFLRRPSQSQSCDTGLNDS